MLQDINLPLILLAALITVASPGPSTLAIAGTSMGSGRGSGMALASGILAGSFLWSLSAAFGLGAIMLANVWVFEALRYCGAGYLMYLAWRSARSALRPGLLAPRPLPGRKRTLFARGFLLHLTNPKAILFFGSLYSLGVPAGAPASDLAIVIGAVGLQSVLVFQGYALLFSSARMAAFYLRLRRGFEGVMALGFGVAGVKILTAKLNS